MAAIMGEWQTAILTGGHKAVQQLQRERRAGEMSQREMEWRRRGGSFKDEQIVGSLSNKSKLTETWSQLPVYQGASTNE